MHAEKSNIVGEWYKVEYTWYEDGSPKNLYKASKNINTRKGAEDFAALIVFLSETVMPYTNKQRSFSNKLVGNNRSVKELTHFYKYVKIEIPIKRETDPIKKEIKDIDAYDEDLSLK